MIMAYCDLLLHNNLSLLEILGWLIDVNLAIVYLMTNFFVKENSQTKLLQLLRLTTKYSNILGHSKNRFL